MAKTTTSQNTAESIITSIKNKNFKPIYLLSGSEEYYIDLIADFAQHNILSDDEKEFNLHIMYGNEVKAEQIAMTAKQYPIMSEHSVIIVKEAKNIRDFAPLINYLQKPLPSSIIILCYFDKDNAKSAKLTKLSTAVKKYGIYYETPRIYDNQLPTWISNYVKNRGYSINNDASLLLADYLGTNLSRVASEIEKLILINGENKNITTDAIEKNIGISKEFTNYELANAIFKRNYVTVNRIVNHFASDEKNHPIPTITSVLFDNFSKLMLYLWLPDKSEFNVAKELGINKFFTKDYANAARNYKSGKVLEVISILRELDAKSKGFKTGPTTYDYKNLLREYIFKIIH